jgi:hypothetical protein
LPSGRSFTAVTIFVPLRRIRVRQATAPHSSFGLSFRVAVRVTHVRQQARTFLEVHCPRHVVDRNRRDMHQLPAARVNMARSKREVPATLVPWHSDRSALMAAAQCTTQSTPSKARAIAASSLISPCACSTARVGSMRRTNAFAVAPSRSSLGSRVAPRAPLAPVTSARLPCSAGDSTWFRAGE